ncbi:sulfite exporter TauE/SafE family protein [Luteitalea sp.]|uniref:sulfite exporter TauE/SafE family protein n=1 Tax=Luteitalea sp. TaxID=2004800 RepID=UPI0025B90F6B|nr:sulfite exporter TauE/SafE family protein [Luteitalea sp.]
MTGLALGAAVGLGLLLGVLGGGGSILLVPVLVYLLGFDAKQAVVISLPVVGLTSLGGAAAHWRHGHVALASAARLGGLAMIAAYLGGRLGVLVPGAVQQLLLAVVMLAASWSMLRPRPVHVEATRASVVAVSPVTKVGAPLGIGLLTGLTGIGGGFLFVPALVLLEHVPFATAVGTSLVVIAINAAAALAGYAGHVPVPWAFVLPFSAVAMVAAVLGARLAPRLPASQLRRAFGALLLAVAVLVVAASLVP